MNYGDFPLEQTIPIFFTTRAFATGIPGTLSAATVAVYEDITATPIETSIAVTESLNSIAGLNAVPIVAIAASGYELGKNYHVVLEAGTVDSVSAVGEVVAYFSIGRSAAAVDLANVTDGLGAIKTETAAILVDTGTTLQAELDAIQAAVITNAAGDDVAADIIAMKVDTAAILVDTSTTLQAELDAIQAAVITNAAGADVAADIIAIKAETAAIVNDTDLIDDGTSGLVKIAADVAAVLVDTGTTLDGKIDVIDTNVDDLKLGIIFGAAETGTLSTTVATTDLTGFASDELIGGVVVWTGGTADGQRTDITDYDSTNGTLTFTAMTTAPVNGDTFKIV